MKIAQVPVEVGIVGNFEGGKALPAEPEWAGLCCLLVERTGIECTPLGRPTATAPAESYKSASWTWFVIIVFIMVIRWHQEKWSPWPVSPSSAGGEILKESPPNFLMPAD